MRAGVTCWTLVVRNLLVGSVEYALLAGFPDEVGMRNGFLFLKLAANLGSQISYLNVLRRGKNDYDVNYHCSHGGPYLLFVPMNCMVDFPYHTIQ